jgi:integrase
MPKRQRNDGLRKLCKCPLRNWSRCSHPWYFSYKPKGGARVRVSLDRHTGQHVGALDDAKTIAANLRTAIVNGEYPPTPQAAQAPAALVTLRAAADRFLEGVPILKGKNHGKTRGANDQQMLAALCAWTPVGVSAPLGDHLPSALTEDVLEAFVAHLRDAGRAASTVNKYIQTIKALDRWLTKKGYRPESALSGESETLRRRQGTRRDRRLVPDTTDDKGKLTGEGEEKRLLKAAGPWMQRLIIAALETGARCGELLALTWGDVDLTRGELRISGDANKTGDGRRLVDLAAAPLRAGDGADRSCRQTTSPPGARLRGCARGAGRLNQEGMGDGGAPGARPPAAVDRHKGAGGRIARCPAGDRPTLPRPAP